MKTLIWKKEIDDIAELFFYSVGLSAEPRISTKIWRRKYRGEIFLRSNKREILSLKER